MSNRIPKVMSLMEKIVRIFDQLDEQLHAGFYFYLMIGTKKFVSNNEYMYPIALIFVGLLVPNVLDFYDLWDKMEEGDYETKAGKKKSEGTKEASLKYLGLLYFMCMMVAIIPFAYYLTIKKYLGLEQESICSFDTKARNSFFD